MKNSTLVTHKCCYPPLTGTPSSVWYPIIPCLEPHPMPGTAPLVWNPITMSGTPSPCLEFHTLSRTPSPCLKPHPMSGTPSLVWNPIPMSGIPSLVWNPIPMCRTPSLAWNPIPSPPPHPSTPKQCPHPIILPPPHHLVPSALHLVLVGPVWPLTGPYPPDLAPGCPLSGTPIPCHPPPAPTLTLSNIITKGPLHLKRKFGFFEFSYVYFNLTSRGFSLTSRNNIFHLAWNNSQNSCAATPFPSIRYLYESPIMISIPSNNKLMISSCVRSQLNFHLRWY